MSDDSRHKGEAIVRMGGSSGLVARCAAALLLIGISAAAHAVPLGPQALYAAQCSSCHGDVMEGGQFGPSLKSRDFANRWRGKHAELLKYISTSMPPNSSGQLSDGDYAILTKMVADANALDRAVDPNAPPEKERVGYLGPKPAPQLFRDATSEKAKAAQAAKLAAL
ncbi:MAG: cytochrome c, partial [Variovorax sp.]